MNKNEFINKLYDAPITLDHYLINDVANKILKEKGAQYLTITSMEELAELSQEISKKARGRSEDNYGLLEEIADVFIAVNMLQNIYGISNGDIIKAINVKIERNKKWIEGLMEGE